MERYWHYKGGFRNPKGSREISIDLKDCARYLWSRTTALPYRAGIDVPKDFVFSEEETLRGLAAGRASGSDSATWLGHCAFLFNIGGLTVLTDPFLRGNSGLWFMRAFERISCPVSFEKLPQPDVILATHDHRDHVHPRSLRALRRHQDTAVIAPLGVGKHFHALGFERYTELDWFESTTFQNVSFTALPAIHYSTVGSGPFHNRSLWAGFKVQWNSQGQDRTIFFSGDTGYGPVFADEVSSHGPFDWACIGIGSYALNQKNSKCHLVHTNPEEAVSIARDISARNLIGMHYGTVHMADEPAMEPIDRVRQAGIDQKFSGTIVTPKIGETIIL